MGKAVSLGRHSGRGAGARYRLANSRARARRWWTAVDCSGLVGGRDEAGIGLCCCSSWGVAARFTGLRACSFASARFRSGEDAVPAHSMHARHPALFVCCVWH